MRLFIALPASLLVLSYGAALAQEAPYQPDIAVLDGQTSLTFPTGGALSLTDGGTIELWVSPKWDEATTYNPVLLSNQGEDGIVYEIAIEADKQGFSLTSGSQMDVFDYNFDDGAVHHIAIVNLNDRVAAMVDGQIIGTSGLSFANLEPQTLHIGSTKDGHLPYSGVIGGVRIWDAALDPETLIEYNWRNVSSDNSDHPYLAFLSGYSEFETEDFVIIDKPIAPVWLAEDPLTQPQETSND